MMGDKTAARAVAQRIGIPTLAGTDEPITERKEAIAKAKEIGFPLIIKAAFGGGGRGMRIVKQASELQSFWIDPERGRSCFRQSGRFPRKVHPKGQAH